MPDIRLVNRRGSRVWIWAGLLAGMGILVWTLALVLGDPTEDREQLLSGAAANFGADRAPVLPVQPTPFENIAPLQTRDLGRFVHLTGTAQSAARANALWVRARDNRRILVRFEPAPPEGAPRVAPGSAVNLRGYLEKVSRAEFNVWMDTLRVAIPRPPPGRKFGDLPDSSFARVDSLFVKNFYVSVRPEGLGPVSTAARATP